MCDGERKTQRSRTASSIAHCSDWHTSHAAPLSVTVHTFPLHTSLLLATSLFLSPHETPGRTQLGHRGLPGKHHLGWVDLFPWFLRGSGEGRGWKSGTKASLPFSFPLNAYTRTASLQAEELGLPCWLISILRVKGILFLLLYKRDYFFQLTTFLSMLCQRACLQSTLADYSTYQRQEGEIHTLKSFVMPHRVGMLSFKGGKKPSVNVYVLAQSPPKPAGQPVSVSRSGTTKAHVRSQGTGG